MKKRILSSLMAGFLVMPALTITMSCYNKFEKVNYEGTVKKTGLEKEAELLKEEVKRLYEFVQEPKKYKENIKYFARKEDVCLTMTDCITGEDVPIEVDLILCELLMKKQNELNSFYSPKFLPLD